MKNTTTLTCPTTIQGVVGISCNSLLFTFFGFIFFVITMWHHERTSRQKHRQAQDAVALRQTFYWKPEIVYRIAPIGEKIIEVRSTLQLQVLCVNG